jgi:hypothetical protein
VITRGEEWGSPAAGPPDLEIEGDDPTLAAALASAGADPLVRFAPSATSDLARAVGLGAGPYQGIALPCDLLAFDRDGPRACNMIVFGDPPDRLTFLSRPKQVAVAVDGRALFDGAATTIVVATGEFLRGLDVVPRGHPGDGRAEVQVYSLRANERAAVRARLRTGTHVPHPRIVQRAGSRIEVSGARPRPLEVDGARSGSASAFTVDVVPAAYRLLV